MTIGVGVEGPSDRAFWDKILHKHFSPLQFDIRSMNGCEKLIREAPQLLDSFRDLGHTAGFLLLDFDTAFRKQAPCPGAILEQFDARIQGEASRPIGERYLFVCVAVRGPEAWFLADAVAISTVLPKSMYAAPLETGTLNAKE